MMFAENHPLEELNCICDGSSPRILSSLAPCEGTGTHSHHRNCIRTIKHSCGCKKVWFMKGWEFSSFRGTENFSASRPKMFSNFGIWIFDDMEICTVEKEQALERRSLLTILVVSLTGHGKNFQGNDNNLNFSEFKVISSFCFNIFQLEGTLATTLDSVMLRRIFST